MTWWEEWLRVPLIEGYLAKSQKTIHDLRESGLFYHIRMTAKPADLVTHRIAGGKERVREVAADTISIFEQSVVGLHDGRLELRDIEVREGGSRVFVKRIPLRPTPMHNQLQPPDIFRSLGVRAAKNYFYEYWYFIRISVTDPSFTWRIDWALRTRIRGRLLRWGLVLSLLPLFYGMVCTSNGGPYLVAFGGILIFLFTMGYTVGYASVETVMQDGGETEYLSHLRQIWVDALAMTDPQLNVPPGRGPVPAGIRTTPTLVPSGTIAPPPQGPPKKPKLRIRH